MAADILLLRTSIFYLRGPRGPTPGSRAESIHCPTDTSNIAMSSNLDQKQNLVETADESSPYEQVNKVAGVVPSPEKQSGQLGGVSRDATSSASEPGGKKESRQYGENISEHGVGGHTVGVEGETKSEGFGGSAPLQSSKTENARTAQGYGNPETEMSENIGA